MTTQKRIALLFGDRVLDRYILPIPPRGGYQQSDPGFTAQYDWQNHAQWQQFELPGGIDMTHAMLAQYSEALEAHVSLPRAPDGLLAKLTLRSVAELGHCDRGNNNGPPTRFTQMGTGQTESALSLRVSRYLGYAGATPPEILYGAPAAMTTPAPDVIVINDAGTELRHSCDQPGNYFREMMDHLSTGGGLACDVVMKMHLPLAEGMAWRAFENAIHARSRTLIVQADDLRKSGVPISPCPSWDRCVQDVKQAWDRGNATLRLLGNHCTSLIVLFDVEGALVLERDSAGELHMRLVFDPTRAERNIANTLPGDIIGKMNCFLAHFTYEHQCGGDPGVTECVIRALTASRLFGESVYTVAEGQLTLPPVGTWMLADKPPRALPPYQQVQIDGAGATSLLARMVTQRGTDFDTLAHDVVINGIKATLSTLPHGRFGHLWTVDVDEIEALRAVDQQIRGYLADQSLNKPLSIGVFGPPGAGKSFGVKQLVDEDEIPIREYNLSQAEAEQLPTFFHEIRDLNLRGTPPLCFFDEFDSQDRLLLKYFLAPMQDGVFLEGGAVRPLGRGVFVFAGGTAATMRQFAQHALPAPTTSKQGDDEARSRAEARAQKLPDFISRLQGFINVKGPNPVEAKASPHDPPTPFADRAMADPTYVLRRAILLRVYLETHLSGIISQDTKIASIETNLLSALLDAQDYTFGARSLELLIKSMAAKRSMNNLSRSDLPIDAVVSMYVHPLTSFTERLAKSPD